MKKLLGAITIAAMVLIGGVTANANPNVAHLAGQGPTDGEFSAWTKQMANGEQIKFYAKYMQPGQKVQFMVQNSAGSYVQYAWKRVETEDLNPDGSYSNMQNHIYFIRTLDLKPGKNRVRILVDGEIVWGTKTYSIKEAETIAPTWVQSASPADVEECKIPDPRPASEKQLSRGQRDGDIIGRDNVGFPASDLGVLPKVDEANIIFAKVAFADAPPSSSIPDGYLKEQAQKMTDLGLHWSQGKFNYKFQVVDGWVEVPVNHSDYPVSPGDDEEHSPEAYERASANMKKIADLVGENLPDSLDFDAADLIVVYWTPNITDFEMSVTWLAGDLTTPIGKKDIAFMSGSKFLTTDSGPGLTAERKREYTWTWLAHDFLHLQGLNEHAPGNGWSTSIGGGAWPSRTGRSAVMSAWENFLMNWFDDSQVHCIKASGLEGQEQVILTPLEVFGGDRKIVVIPTVDYKALVIESRRPIGISDTLPSSFEGLLVYEIDTNSVHVDHGPNKCTNSRENTKWAYYLLPDGKKEASDCNNPEPYFMRPGDTLTHSGLRIELVHSASQADYIAVRPAGLAGLSPASEGNPLNISPSNTFFQTLAGNRKHLNNSHCGCCGCAFLGGVQ